MATNQFLPFATALDAQVVAQSAYTSIGWRNTGFLAGILENEMINKVLRQSSVMSSALAQVIVDNLQVDVLDNGDVGGVVTLLKNTFSAGLPFDPNGTYPPGSIGDVLQDINENGGAGLNADLLRQLLEDGLNEDQLTPGLRNRLAQLDAPTTGLVTQVAELQATYGPTISAANSAAAAAQSRSDAITAANVAAAAAGEAATSQSSANTFRQQAQTAAGTASTAATNAQSSASSAAASASAAGTSATTAANSATAAAGSASAAATSATSATSSSGAAGTAATAAQNSATAAQSSAGAASTSAGQAATSATAAGNSSAAAGTSATQAASSANAAGSSATAASGSASNAATSATNAGTSASSAQSNATAAQTAASNASTSATTASNAATSAQGSASSASTSATNAATAAGNAGNAATSANTSASNAAASASASGNSAQAAADYYNSTVAATGNLSASVQTLSSAVASLNGAYSTTAANYLMKVAATRPDGSVVMAGIGLAASANNVASQSSIILQGDNLVFVPSSNPNAPLTNLFQVQDVGGVATLVVPRAIIPQIITGMIAASQITTDKLVIGSVTANVTATVNAGLGSSFSFSGPSLTFANTPLFVVTKQQGPVVISGYVKLLVTCNDGYTGAQLVGPDVQPVISPASGAPVIGSSDWIGAVRSSSNRWRFVRQYPVLIVIPAGAVNQAYTVSLPAMGWTSLNADGTLGANFPAGSTAQFNFSLCAVESKV